MERYFPNHKLRLSILTWNMSSRAPGNYHASVRQILRLKGTSSVVESLPEMYVIGLQETPNSELVVGNLQIGIQAVLGPSYVLLRWCSLGMLHASIWLRRELLWSCTAVEMIPIHTRPIAANQIRTKGAVALSFGLFGTSFLFINTHLSAHEANIRTRINQVEKVQQALHLQHPTSVNSLDSGMKRLELTGNRSHKHREYVFWFGDLNFRLELPTNSVMQLIQSIADSASDGLSELIS